MDNAENNTTMMKSLKGLLHMCDLDAFDAKEHQIFCFPHTMNVCTGHIVLSLSLSPINREPHENHIVPREQMYEQALACDPIAMARAAIRVSGARRDAFTAVIRDGNMDRQFKNPDTGMIMRISPLKLLWDVPSRWDSVYYMIHRFQYLRLVSGRVNLTFCMTYLYQQAVDNLLAQPHIPELTKYRLSKKEWEVLQDFEVILSVIIVITSHLYLLMPMNEGIYFS